jgi:hypothetical protein
MDDERKSIYASIPTNINDYVCRFQVNDEHTGPGVTTTWPHIFVDAQGRLAVAAWLIYIYIYIGLF